MNTRRPISETSTPVSLSVAFNQDASCFAVGLNSGFCSEQVLYQVLTELICPVFNAESCELDVKRRKFCSVSYSPSLSKKAFNGGIGQVQMLERSNYMALIGGGIHPRYKQNIVIFEFFPRRSLLTL